MRKKSHFYLKKKNLVFKSYIPFDFHSKYNYSACLQRLLVFANLIDFRLQTVKHITAHTAVVHAYENENKPKQLLI